MRWREKFFWWKICDNELGDNIPYTLCIPQSPPFCNFLPWGLKQDNLEVWLPPVYHVKSLLGGYREWENKTCHEFN